jgi:hypothetical protein
LLLEMFTDMGPCTIWLIAGALLAIAGWGLAFSYRRRALRYRAAFERAFEIARRVYQFTEDESDELSRMIGEPVERS